MPRSKYTNLRVLRITRARLRGHVQPGESVNDLIVRLLDFYEDPKRVLVDAHKLGFKDAVKEDE